MCINKEVFLSLIKHFLWSQGCVLLGNLTEIREKHKLFKYLTNFWYGSRFVEFRYIKNPRLRT